MSLLKSSLMQPFALALLVASSSAQTLTGEAVATCPSVNLAGSIKVVQYTDRWGPGRNFGQSDGIVQQFFPLSGCSDLCNEPLPPQGRLKQVRVDEPGDVFLILAGPNDLYWKPAAAEGSRIVGVLTVNPARLRVYRPGGVLGESQLTLRAEAATAECATLKSAELPSGLPPDDNFVASLVHRVLGRTAQQIFQR